MRRGVYRTAQDRLTRTARWRKSHATKLVHTSRADAQRYANTLNLHALNPNWAPYECTLGDGPTEFGEPHWHVGRRAGS